MDTLYPNEVELRNLKAKEFTASLDPDALCLEYNAIELAKIALGEKGWDLLINNEKGKPLKQGVINMYSLVLTSMDPRLPLEERERREKEVSKALMNAMVAVNRMMATNQAADSSYNSWVIIGLVIIGVIAMILGCLIAIYT